MAIDDGLLFAGNNGGDIKAYPAETLDEGGAIWSYEVSHNTAARFSVADGVVYAGAGSYVVALDANTTNLNGEALWSCDTNDYVYGAPVYSNGKLYVGLENYYLVAFNAETENPHGEPLWAYLCETNMYAAPAISGGVLYSTSYDGSVYAFASNTQVTFTETGLSEGTSWSVTFDGVTQNSTLNNIVFMVCTDGEYSYSIETPDGYYSNNTLTGTIVVNGTDASISVNFISDAPVEYTLFSEVYVNSVLMGSQEMIFDAGEVVHVYLDELPPQWTFDYVCLDGVNTTDTEFTLTMDQNHTVKVYLKTSILTLTVITTIGGLVDTGNDTLYQYGDMANLTATADAGYVFTCWMVDGETNSTDNPLAITMDGNHTITAVFTEIPTTIIAINSNQTYTVRLEGNITAKQMTNMTITPHSENATTSVAFTVTGPSGEVGYGTIILPKEAIPYGSTPLVYIDG